MPNIPGNTAIISPAIFKGSTTSTTHNILRQLAFDNTAQANIISTPCSGKIILVNNAACNLLGYSKKELLTKSRTDIFDINESGFKKMLKQRTADGHSIALVTALKKDGNPIPCEITSAVFTDGDGTEQAVTSIADMSPGILKQKRIDIKNKKIVSHNIVLAKSQQKEIDTKNKKIVSDNIDLARSEQKKIDIRNEKIVADNIVQAKYDQKLIDTKNEKIVADNILLAQERSDARQADNKRQNKELEDKLEQEIKLKKKQIVEATEDAKETERSDIGKELHDNINQLLAASRMYVEMAKRGGKNSEIYLNRSSEYTLEAIEEIRKLTSVLTTDIIKDLGLCDAIEHLSHDTMETSLLIISCSLESFKEDSINDKFKLNVYRIIQEQLNNILKHAQATEVNISLLQNKRSIMLTISDNGIGFDTEKKPNGIGIANIKSRAMTYNGMADFVSHSGQGCVLTARFPIVDAVT